MILEKMRVKGVGSSLVGEGHLFHHLILLLGELDDEIIKKFFLDLESSLSGVLSDEGWGLLVGRDSLDVSELSGLLVGAENFSDFSGDVPFIDSVEVHDIDESVSEDLINSSLHFGDLSVVWEVLKFMRASLVPDVHVGLVEVGEQECEENFVGWLDVLRIVDFEDPLELQSAAEELDSLGHRSQLVSLWVLDLNLVEPSLVLVVAGSVVSQLFLAALVDEVVKLVEEVDLINIGVASHDAAGEESLADFLGLVSEDVSSDILVEVGDGIRLGEVLLAVSLELVLFEWGAGQAGEDVVDLIDNLVLDFGDSLAGEVEFVDLGGLEEEIEGSSGGASSDADDWGNSHSVSFHLDPVNLDGGGDLVESSDSELLISGVETVFLGDTPSESGLEMLDLNDVLVVLELLGIRNEFSASRAAVGEALAEKDALHDGSAGISAFSHAEHAGIFALFSAKVGELTAKTSKAWNSS